MTKSERLVLMLPMKQNELYPEDGRGDLSGLGDELEGSDLILVTIPFPLSEL